MWRGPPQAAHSIDSSPPSRGGTATSSSPRRGTPGLSRSPCRGKAPRRTPASWAGSTTSPLIAVTRDGGEGRAADQGRRGPARLRARRVRHRDDAPRARPMARLLRAAGATEIVPWGRPRLVPRRTVSGAERDDASRASKRASPFRLRPQPRVVFSAHQMGIRPDGRGPRCPSVRPVRSRSRRSYVTTPGGGALRRRRLAVPDRDRRQPDDHGDGDSPDGSREGPRRDADRPVVSRSGHRPAGFAIAPLRDGVAAVPPSPACGDDERDRHDDDRAGDDRPRCRSARPGRWRRG